MDCKNYSHIRNIIHHHENDMSVRATVTENMEDLSRSIMKNLYFKREVVIL